jgi:hypothetical protein
VQTLKVIGNFGTQIAGSSFFWNGVYEKQVVCGPA